jgi:small subunit ribosomal protein S20
MANHQSSIKRIRQTDKKRLHNRYYAKTARNAVKALRNTLDKAEAQAENLKKEKLMWLQELHH